MNILLWCECASWQWCKRCLYARSGVRSPGVGLRAVKARRSQLHNKDSIWTYRPMKELNKRVKSTNLTWSVERQPSNPAVRIRFPLGSEISIPILGLGVCPLCYYLVLLWRRLCILLTTESESHSIVLCLMYVVCWYSFPERHFYPNNWFRSLWEC